MTRNVLIGNGINIQFGGKDKYSNHAILGRMFENMRAGKYEQILPACSAKDQIQLFEGLKQVLINIDNYQPSEEYLFLDIEKERAKRLYSETTKLEDIGMEDFFLALEIAGFKANDKEDFRKEAQHEMQMPILDAIYNDGAIDHIDYGNGVRKFLSGYDNIFTINYDSNLDKFLPKVYHLHGQFSQLAPEFDANSDFSREHQEQCRSNEVVPGFEHVYSNAIMSWYWLEKYGDWMGKESTYGADKFQALNGKLDIIGMAPSNDDHLFIMISQSGISSVDYYYHDDSDRSEMQRKFKAKPITYKSVDKLWNRLNR